MTKVNQFNHQVFAITKAADLKLGFEQNYIDSL
jgi:hypothetical protein